MKTKTFLALFCLLCISSGFSSCQRHSSDQWKLVWEDNFDQKTGFDPQVWSKIPRGKSDWNNYMTDFDSCFDMRDGNMVLRGIINYSQPNDTAPYLTGGIYTKGKKAFSNGRLEIRAKLNGARGEWPAIWMLPIDAPWPMGGEIDIMGTSESRYNRLSDYTYQLYAQSGYQRQSVITLRRCDQSRRLQCIFSRSIRTALHSISMTHILSPIPASKQTKKGSFLSTSLSIY